MSSKQCGQCQAFKVDGERCRRRASCKLGCKRFCTQHAQKHTKKRCIDGKGPTIKQKKTKRYTKTKRSFSTKKKSFENPFDVLFAGKNRKDMTCVGGYCTLNK